MLRKLQKEEIQKIFSIEGVPFKVLILDEKTKNIIAPLFSMAELREFGICAHFTISSNRTPIEDLPAVYYVKDFNFVAQDIFKLLYGEYYVHSSGQIKRAELENFATKISVTREANRIKLVTDTFTDFIALQSNLFIFNLHHSYITDYSRKIINGLFSVFVTMNKKPFIVGNAKATEVKNNIFKMLETKFRTTKIVKSTIKRPLLILLDRDIDLISPMKHTLGFTEIIDDIFDFNLNKVSIDNNNEYINIDVDNEFYKKQWSNNFVDVVDLINEQVLTYKKEIAVKNLNVNDVSKMLEVAPDLQKKNEVVNSLLNVSLKAVQEIKKRSLDSFYAMENDFRKEDVMDLSEKGTNEDILRFCVSLLKTKNANLIGPLLEKRKISTKVIAYLKKFLNEETGYGAFFSNKMKSLFMGKTNPLVSYVEDVLAQIKNGSLENVFETSQTEDSIQMDEISEIVVFCVGGVTYNELSQFREMEEKYKIPVILGGTEMINAKKLIEQIEKLE